MKLNSMLEINQNAINQVSGGNKKTPEEQIAEGKMIKRKTEECRKNCNDPNGYDCTNACNWAIKQVMHFRNIVGTMEKEMEEMRSA